MNRVVSTWLALAALGCGQQPASAPAPPPPSPWALALEEADAQVDFRLQRIEAQPSSWLPLEQAALAHLQRARLDRGLSDHAAAQALLERAFELAPEGSGPLLTQARLELALHMTDAAERTLDRADARVLSTAAQHELSRLTRAELALARGELDAAQDGFEALLEPKPGVGALAGLAQVHAARGQRQEAEARYEQLKDVMVPPKPESAAWLELQRGELDLRWGDPAAALEHFNAADELLPGFPLVMEHRAQAHGALGQLEQTIALYEQTLALDPEPSTRDALSELLPLIGQRDRAIELAELAAAEHMRRMNTHPEAAAGGLVQHCLLRPTLPAGPVPDPTVEQCLSVARADVQQRPTADATLRLTRLLRSQGRSDQILPLVTGLSQAGWRTPELTELLKDLDIQAPLPSKE